MTTLTAETLDELDRLAKAATPGPYEYDPDAKGSEDSPGLYTTSPKYEGQEPPSPIFTSTAFWSHSDGFYVATILNHADALIAAARERETMIAARAEEDRNIAKAIRKLNDVTAERDRPAGENVKLRDAIRKAGFSVMQTSGDWSIHDVSEKAKQDEARELQTINENIRLAGELRERDAMLDRIRSIMDIDKMLAVNEAKRNVCPDCEGRKRVRPLRLRFDDGPEEIDCPTCVTDVARTWTGGERTT